MIFCYASEKEMNDVVETVHDWRCGKTQIFSVVFSGVILGNGMRARSKMLDKGGIDDEASGP